MVATRKQTTTVVMSTEMKMYLEEREAQKRALLKLVDLLLKGGMEKGLDLAVLIFRAMKLLESLAEENREAANKDYLERLEATEGQPFSFQGHKFTKNSDTKKVTIIGETARQIKELEKQAKEFTDKIKVLEAGAKESGVNVRTKVTEAKVKFKITPLAPKSKPAA